MNKNNTKISKDKKRQLLSKKENALFNKLELCKETKCGSLRNKADKVKKQFKKVIDKICPPAKTLLSNDKHYKCANEIYEKSIYKKLFDEYIDCINTNCKNVKQKKKKTTKKIIAYDMSKLKNHFSKKNKSNKTYQKLK